MNSELLHCNYIVTYKAHHVYFCYYANSDPLHNSNTVNLERKEIQNQNREQPKIKVEKMDRNFCVLNASTLHVPPCLPQSS